MIPVRNGKINTIGKNLSGARTAGGTGKHLTWLVTIVGITFHIAAASINGRQSKV